jgi:hypothetical protein
MTPVEPIKLQGLKPENAGADGVVDPSVADNWRDDWSGLGEVVEVGGAEIDVGEQVASNITHMIRVHGDSITRVATTKQRIRWTDGAEIRFLEITRRRRTCNAPEIITFDCVEAT